MERSKITRTDQGSDRRWRVAVLDTQASSRTRLIAAAREGGVDISVAGVPRPDIVALIRQTRCDAVLLSPDEPDAATPTLGAELSRPVVLCSEDTSSATVRAAQHIGAMAFLVKPIRPDQVVPTLALAITRFREMQLLRRSLAERKVIERAKGRLMVLHGATEEDAFRWLRRRAMDTRSRIAEVARAVLHSGVASHAQGA